MGREEPLWISCDDCPGGNECRDCLVEFFLGERNAWPSASATTPPAPSPTSTLTSRPPSTPSPPTASSPRSSLTAAATAAPAPPDGRAGRLSGRWPGRGGRMSG